MGKFMIKVSGTDFKSEIISETFFLDNASEETVDACKKIFEEDYSCYALCNISADVIDIEAMYNDFEVNENDAERVKATVYNHRREKAEAEKAEYEQYLKLKQKYEK